MSCIACSRFFHCFRSTSACRSVYPMSLCEYTGDRSPFLDGHDLNVVGLHKLSVQLESDRDNFRRLCFGNGNTQDIRSDLLAGVSAISCVGVRRLRVLPAIRLSRLSRNDCILATGISDQSGLARYFRYEVEGMLKSHVPIWASRIVSSDFEQKRLSGREVFRWNFEDHVPEQISRIVRPSRH